MKYETATLAALVRSDNRQFLEYHETFAVPRGIYQRSMSVNELDSSIYIVINDVYEYQFDIVTNEFFEINGISR